MKVQPRVPHAARRAIPRLVEHLLRLRATPIDQHEGVRTVELQLTVRDPRVTREKTRGKVARPIGRGAVLERPPADRRGTDG